MVQVNEVDRVVVKNVPDEPCALGHLDVVLGLVEGDRAKTATKEGVVFRCEPRVFLEQNVMVVGVKTIPYHRDVGLVGLDDDPRGFRETGTVFWRQQILDPADLEAGCVEQLFEVRIGETTAVVHPCAV